jgi:hypothetical protein
MIWGAVRGFATAPAPFGENITAIPDTYPERRRARLRLMPNLRNIRAIFMKSRQTAEQDECVRFHIFARMEI